MCIVTGSRQYSVDLPQGGLEIPCRYIFRTNNYTESEKARKLVEATFAVKILPTSEDAPTPVEAPTSVEVPTPMETPAHEDFGNSMIDPQIQTYHSADTISVITYLSTLTPPA